LEDIIDFFPDPVFAIDLDGKVVAWNQAMAELSGIPAADMLGKGNYEYALPLYGIRRPILIDLALNWDDEGAKSYKDIKHVNGALVSEVESVTVGQQRRHLWNTARKLYNGDGECIGAIEIIRDITALRQAEDIRERFELMAAESRDIILFVNFDDGRILEANEAAVKAYGFSRTELLSMSVSDLRAPEYNHLLGPQLSEANARGTLFESEHVRRDGTLFPVEVSSRGVDVGGKRILISIVRDINERKKFEASQRRQHRRLLLAVSATADAIWEWNLVTQTTYYSPRWYEMLGFADQEIPMTFENWKKLCHPEDLQPTLDVIQSRLAAADDLGYAVEFRMRAKDGTWVWVLGRGRVVERSARGEPVLLSGTNTDITDRKRTEAALRENQERFLRLANSMPQLVWTADPDGQVDYYNERHKEYSGIFQMPDGSFHWAPVLHEEDEAPTVEAWRHALRTGEIYQIEHRVQRLNGSYHWHLSRALPVRDSAGRIVKWFGTATDIDKVKQAEAALRQLNETLEQRVAERSRLAEARARQLQALAVELIEAEERERRQLSQLLHDDLQQLLAAARMQLQAAAESLPADPLLENVERLLSESIHKTRRLSHDLSPPVLHHSGLVAILQMLAEKMEEQFGLQIMLQTTGEQRVENASLKVFLFRAVQELLFNVVKHAGVKSARLGLAGTDTGIEITLSDQGRGFDPEMIAATVPSAGIGLVSLRERAKAVGGDLVIESAPGQGSRFILTVPVRLNEAEKPQAPAVVLNSGCPIGPTASAKTGCTRVLLVDDHKVMRQGLNMLITGKPDIQVVGEASNGREAVERTRQLHPDVIVMDVSMPVMDGVEATRQIKAEWPGIRVIGLSMMEDVKIDKQMRAAGAEAFVSKTASSAELLKVIYGIAG